MPQREGHQAQPREVCLRGSLRHALWIHSLGTWHRGQPREGLSHDQRGTNSRPQGSAEGYGMTCGPEPLHLTPWRKRLASVPPLEKIRTLFLDPRGRRSPHQAQGTAHQSSRPSTTNQGRGPLTLRHHNDPSGQRSRSSREAGRGACPTHPMTYLLHQRSAL